MYVLFFLQCLYKYYILEVYTKINYLYIDIEIDHPVASIEIIICDSFIIIY